MQNTITTYKHGKRYDYLRLCCKNKNNRGSIEMVDYLVDDDECVSLCLEGLPRNCDIFKTSAHVLGILSFDQLIPKLLQEE